MTPVSLMPPVDYCPSCEGRKAESAAVQIGEARAQRAELQSTADSAPASAPDAAAPTAAEAPVAAGNDPKAVAGTVQSLLAPDLAVQASLAGSSIETRQGAAGGSEAETLRLRAAQVYRGL